MVALLIVICSMVCAATQFRPNKHTVSPMMGSAFNSVISKLRTKTISVVVFYDSKKVQPDFLEEVDAVAAKMNRMVKFVGTECNIPGNAKFCNEHGANPANDPKGLQMKFFPVLPMNPEFYPNANISTITRDIHKLIPGNNIKRINTIQDAQMMLVAETSMPSVFWLAQSKAKAFPGIFKGLAVEFQKEMNFGYVAVNQDNEGDVSKILKTLKLDKHLKKTGYPLLVQVDGSSSAGTIGEVHVYDGDMKEPVFSNMYDFINTRKQTFVSGGGFDENRRGTSSSSPKPWLIQAIPEVYQQSASDVCLKNSKESLCAIYLTNGALSDDEEKLLVRLSEKFQSKLTGRLTTEFKWSYMNIGIETGFRELFKPEKTPSFVVFNPFKRMRFVRVDDSHDGSVEDAIISLVDKILGGDARFTTVKGQKLPEFVVRETKKDEL